MPPPPGSSDGGGVACQEHGGIGARDAGRERSLGLARDPMDQTYHQATLVLSTSVLDGDLHALEVPFVRIECFRRHAGEPGQHVDDRPNDLVEELHYIRHAAAEIFALELSAFHFGEHFVPGIRGPF